MCLIIVGIKSDVMKLDLEKAWQRNPDGAGVIGIDAPIFVAKGLMKPKHLRKALAKIDDLTTIAIHYRMGTHGAKNAINTHPFKCGADTWLMHNGVLHDLGKRGTGPGGESDSGHLARILSYLPLEDKLALLHQLDGGNRFLLAREGEYTTIGDWIEYKDCEMSNECIKPFEYAYNATKSVQYWRNGKMVTKEEMEAANNASESAQEAFEYYTKNNGVETRGKIIPLPAPITTPSVSDTVQPSTYNGRYDHRLESAATDFRRMDNYTPGATAAAADDPNDTDPPPPNYDRLLDMMDQPLSPRKRLRFKTADFESMDDKELEKFCNDMKTLSDDDFEREHPAH